MNLFQRIYEKRSVSERSNSVSIRSSAKKEQQRDARLTLSQNCLSSASSQTETALVAFVTTQGDPIVEGSSPNCSYESRTILLREKTSTIPTLGFSFLAPKGPYLAKRESRKEVDHVVRRGAREGAAAT